jgi:hypothetical protein
VIPIRIAVKARENPVMAIAFIAGVTLAVFGFGYMVGRKPRRGVAL